MSRLHPKKNLEAVIDAFLDASLDARRAWRLVIAGMGDPDYVASLRRRVDERQASSKVSFAGWVEGDAKLALMRSASVMTLCSKHENFGLAALEAMAVGVPVVLSREVDLSAGVQGAGAGWISDDLGESLRAALGDAIGGSEQRRDRSRAAREFARSFTWPTIGSQLIRTYSNVLAARTPTGSFA
jgi:glycosyltransferase involved in cell wall biosynthesis